MNRKMIPSMIFVLLIISSPAAADLFVTPYGSYSNFIEFPTSWTLEIDTPLFSESVAVSELDNGSGAVLLLASV